MKLSDWIASVGGVNAAAKLLSITPGAVSKWFSENRTPNIKTIRKIVDFSDGKVTLDAIFAETKPVRGTSCKKSIN